MLSACNRSRGFGRFQKPPCPKSNSRNKTFCDRFSFWENRQATFFFRLLNSNQFSLKATNFNFYYTGPENERRTDGGLLPPFLFFSSSPSSLSCLSPPVSGGDSVSHRTKEKEEEEGRRQKIHGRKLVWRELGQFPSELENSRGSLSCH